MTTVADAGTPPRAIRWKFWQAQATGPAAGAAAPPQPIDLSLHSNGATYIDQNGESGRLINRIERSISSVVGLAGVRGAGKSSLAKRVLQACDDRGYFVLLIPSPTAYDPREFLISVFQRTAEACANRLKRRIWGGNDPAQKGAQSVREARRGLVIAIGLTILFLVATSGAMYYLAIVQANLLEQQNNQLQINDLDQQIAAANQILGSIGAASTAPKASAGNSSSGADSAVSARSGLPSKESGNGDALAAATSKSKPKALLSKTALLGQYAPPTLLFRPTPPAVREIKAELSHQLNTALNGAVDGARVDVLRKFDFQNQYDVPNPKSPAAALLFNVLMQAPHFNEYYYNVPSAIGELSNDQPARLFNAKNVPLFTVTRAHDTSTTGVVIGVFNNIFVPSSDLDPIEDEVYKNLIGDLGVRRMSLQKASQPSSLSVILLENRYAPGTLLTVFAMLALLIVLVSYRRIVRLARSYIVQSRHERDVGLLQRCNDFIDRMQFETTRTTGSEVGLVANFLSGKVSRAKQLADRPLSLPSLSAACADFLDDVGEEFNGKVVICIDELDKITDPQQLLDLLKGVKGILGSDNTHFILTVSEDAVAMFKERRGGRRTMVESAFEEIVYLDRLNFPTAEQIAQAALRDSPADELAKKRLAALFWIFGAGVPREIKRCILQSLFSRPDQDAFEVWRGLFLEMLTNLSVPRGDDPATQVQECAFMETIETIKAKVRFLDPSQADVREFRAFLERALAASLNSTGKKGNADRDSDGAGGPYFSASVEILIGAACMELAASRSALPADGGDWGFLVDSYKYLPQNAHYAYHCLGKFAPAH